MCVDDFRIAGFGRVPKMICFPAPQLAMARAWLDCASFHLHTLLAEACHRFRLKPLS